MSEIGKAGPWKRAFLAALRRTGSPAKAARAADIDRPFVYRVRRTDPEFASQWDAALVTYAERIEAKAIQVAEKGWTEKTEVVDPDGRKTTTTRERYSPQATVRVLESLSPGRWGRKVEHRHGGTVTLTTPAMQARLLADPEALEAACQLAARLAAPPSPPMALPVPAIDVTPAED